ncbi:MAG: hypothetical protein NTY12_02530 [Candidatus Falkowbacteria bacterium]|nr:hypothetical protein [Candidatus Falkowbacteria bacterium]
MAIITFNNIRAKARDTKRVADVKQIATALELYYSDNNSYPVIITPGNSLASPDGSTIYMAKIPSNPTPRTDGTCSNIDYGYTYLASINSYNISTCLGSPASNFNPGVVSYSPSGSFNCGQRIADADGNQYDTVEIGGQCWMKQNLNAGTMVTSVNTGSNHSNQTNDSLVEKYCYSNLSASCVTYGGLYEWQEAMALPASCVNTDCSSQIQTPHQGICPSGWHIPTDAEFNILEQYAIQTIGSSSTQFACNNSVASYRRCADDNGADSGGAKGAGKALKKVGQGSGAGAGDDLLGFSAMLGGYRAIGGSFIGSLSYATFWQSSQYAANSSWLRNFYTSYTTILRYGLNEKSSGYNVRCLKN